MRFVSHCFPIFPELHCIRIAFSREEQHVPSRSSDARCVPTAAQLAAAAPSSMPAPGRRMSSHVGPPWSSMVLHGPMPITHQMPKISRIALQTAKLLIVLFGKSVPCHLCKKSD